VVENACSFDFCSVEGLEDTAAGGTLAALFVRVGPGVASLVGTGVGVGGTGVAVGADVAIDVGADVDVDVAVGSGVSVGGTAV
jgi:hypothetical protein